MENTWKLVENQSDFKCEKCGFEGKVRLKTAKKRCKKCGAVYVKEIMG